MQDINLKLFKKVSLSILSDIFPLRIIIKSCNKLEYGLSNSTFICCSIFFKSSFEKFKLFIYQYLNKLNVKMLHVRIR